MVQLKGKTLTATEKPIGISIPYGSIKRSDLMPFEKEDIDFNSLWFN